MSGEELEAGFTFIWKVENFSMMPHQIGESLDSPKFVVDVWKDTEWFLDLYPRGDEDEESEGHISLFFSKIPSDVELKLTYALALKASDSTFVEISRNTNIIDSEWGWSQFICLKDFNVKRDLYTPQDILTMSLNLQLPEESTSESTDKPSSDISRKQITFRSGIQIQQRSALWSIKSPLLLSDRIDKDLSEIHNDTPNLKVSLLFNEKNNVCIPIEIKQFGSKFFVNKTERLFVKCKITVIGNNVLYRDSKESTHLFDSDLADVWSFPLFLESYNLTRDKYLDANEALNLWFDFVFSYKDGVYHWDSDYKPGSIALKTTKQESEWYNILKSNLNSSMLSDVTLKTGDKMFPAYRVVLSAYSSVFSAMFENDMKEKNSGVVEIEDVEPSTVQRMLEFLRSGVLDKDLSTEDAADLYRAADTSTTSFLLSKDVRLLFCLPCP